MERYRAIADRRSVPNIDSMRETLFKLGHETSAR
jgi:hypothetical protein